MSARARPAQRAKRDEAIVITLAGLAVAAVLLGIAVAISRRPTRRRKRALKALLEACHGEQDLAERLVLSEMERDDGIGYAEAARRARVRLQRDRR